MDAIEFLMKGSEGDQYRIRFQLIGAHFAASCSCIFTAMKNQCCKHRFQIMNGNSENIVSNNQEKVAEVATWLPGSDIATPLAERGPLLAELERTIAEVEHAKTNQKRAKAAVDKIDKRIEAIMHDRPR